MIRRITIKNFQSHENLEIELDPNLTVIVGSSDVGKSAVIRSLRWVLLNSPQGVAFIRDGQSDASVSVDVDGSLVTRRRGKGVNSYEIDGEELVAFKTSVPDTVARLLNVSDLNFQNQHDAPFWFSLSAGDVSRRLNSIVDLGVIDQSLSHISKTVRKLQGGVEAAYDRLRRLRRDKEDLEWVENANAALVCAESAYTDMCKIAARVRELSMAMDDASSAERVAHDTSVRARHGDLVVKKAEEYLDQCGVVANLRETLESARMLKSESETVLDFSDVDMWYSRSVSVHDKRENLENVLLDVKSAGVAVKSGSIDMSPVHCAYDAMNEIKRSMADLTRLIQVARMMQDRYSEAVCNADAAENELSERVGGVCPVCGGVI